MKDTDYGKKMGQALGAVRKMHSQVSQMFLDCDDLFPGYTSVFGSKATRDLTSKIEAGLWMADGVYRYWCKSNGPVVGITVMFFPPEDNTQFGEPLLVVGKIDYKNFDPQHPREQCDGWHLWASVLEWGTQPFQLKQVREIDGTDNDEWKKIARIVSIAEPLFSIESLADVKAMFGKVGVDAK